MPASTSQRRTKPKVRRNSDVISIASHYADTLNSQQLRKREVINGVYWYDFAHFGEKPVSHTQREV